MSKIKAGAVTSKSGSAKSTPTRDPARLTITVSTPAEAEKGYAREIVRPVLQAALSVRRFHSPATSDNLTMDALVAELDGQCKAVSEGDLSRGEAMLTAQAHTLDAIFGECARRAKANMAEYLNAADTYLRLGLRAQAQCRATWETLSAMKNPPPFAFVRQANIANGPQQVNNGIGQPSPTRENETSQNKLLEAERGERLDTAAASTAGSADPQMEAVGTVQRAEVDRGEG